MHSFRLGLTIACASLIGALGCASSDNGTSGSHTTTSHSDASATDSGASGDDTGTTTTPGDDTGTTTTPGDDTGTTTTPGDDTGTTSGDTGADAGCKAPGTLHPPKAGAGDFYCPFVAPAKTFCKDQTEHCCEPSTGSASCQPIGTACATGDTDWQCDDPSECPSGQKCCGIGKLVINADPACANYASKFKGTHCAASCDAAAEIEMCTSNAECSTGTCTPFTTKGSQVGGCH
jgi:hypothetical protein